MDCVLLCISQDHLKNNKRTMVKAWYDANVELHKEKKCKNAHNIMLIKTMKF